MLSLLKICSYSEYYDEETDLCKPCDPGSFSILNDQHSCKRCQKQYEVPNRDIDLEMICDDLGHY